MITDTEMRGFDANQTILDRKAAPVDAVTIAIDFEFQDRPLRGTVMGVSVLDMRKLYSQDSALNRGIHSWQFFCFDDSSPPTWKKKAKHFPWGLVRVINIHDIQATISKVF